MAGAVDPDLAAFARDAGLVGAGETGRWTPLNAGVSSEIWRLDAGPRSYCLKRALGTLRTKAEWTAPAERFLYEWRWFELVGRIRPGAAPPLVGRRTRNAHSLQPRQSQIGFIARHACKSAVDHHTHALDCQRSFGDRCRQHDLAFARLGR